MKPFQERVVREKEELDVKLSALAAFILNDTYTGCSVEERKRLTGQYMHMQAYSSILGERIAAFKEE